MKTKRDSYGDVRIVYRVHAEIIEVLIVAVGPRRNDEVYRTARKRTQHKSHDLVFCSVSEGMHGSSPLLQGIYGGRRK